MIEGYLEFPDSPYDKLENCLACDRVGLNNEGSYKQCIFCDYLLINDNKKMYNSFKLEPKMNYFIRLIREMNVKYYDDNTPFLTREETICIGKRYKGLMIFIIQNNFDGNVNTRYYINKIMDYFEIKPELRIKYRVSKITQKKLDDLFFKYINE